MMNSKLREILDKTYELEGLVHLALKRDDSAADFLHLIQKKGREIGEMCENIKEFPKENTATAQNDTADDSFSLNEYSIDEEEEEENSEPPQRGKLVFSINEKFRFKKELFRNSDVDFNNTLALIASMENYEEAEDYFINEEGFEREDPVVKEFLVIIKRYFK